MMEHCHCGTTADDGCSCDRSIVHVFDLATPRVEIVGSQPPPSKRKRRAYKSMTAAGETDVVRTLRFTASTETLHLPPASGFCDTELQATDHCRAPDFRAATELQITDGQVSDFDGTVQDPRAADFCAAIMSDISDGFDAVDLTGFDYRQRSVVGGWDDRVRADSVQTRSLENGAGMDGEARNEKESLWTRFKEYICRRLFCYRQ